VVPLKIQPLTYLDRSQFTDSSLNENETWDCFAQKTELRDSSIFVWQTTSVKHAFYMASDILLSYHLANAFVRAIGSGSARKYQILILPPVMVEERSSLIKTLKRDGFLFAKLIP